MITHGRMLLGGGAETVARAGAKGNSFDSDLPAASELPPALHFESRTAAFEVLLARRSAKQETVHQQLLAQGVRPHTHTEAGKRFKKAVRETHAKNTDSCSPEGFANIKDLAELLSNAGEGLGQWWQQKGQLRYIKHGQWGIFGKHYNDTKINFIHKYLCEYQKKRPIQRICELGFMAGNSALLFLETIKQARLVSFDLGDCPWTHPLGDLMHASYGPRFELVVGLSNNTVHSYGKEHPELRCDVVFVDGSKYPDPRLQDLYNFRTLSRSGTVLFYDEAATMPCVKASVPSNSPLCGKSDHGMGRAARAYNIAARQELVRVVDCEWPRPMCSRGMVNVEGEKPGTTAWTDCKGGIVGYTRVEDGSCVAEYV